MRRIFMILVTPIAIVCLIVAGIVSAWIACEVYHARTSSAKSISTYAEYRAQLPTPKSLKKITKEEEYYYAFFGPVKAPLALPSGPPVYIFDSNGALVDWTYDTGDDSRFNKAWGFAQGSDIDISQYEDLLTKN